MNQQHKEMNQQHKDEILEGSLNYWIEYNYKVAKGIYYGEEWLDDGSDVMEFGWYGNRYGNKVLPVYKEGRKVICYGGIGMMLNK